MYGLKLDENGRILHAVTEEFITQAHVSVDTLPDGDITQYCYTEEGYVFQSVEEAAPEATRLDTLEAQTTYTAMMTDTLLEV